MTKNNSSSLAVSMGQELGVAWLGDSGSGSLVRLQSHVNWCQSHLKACAGLENAIPGGLLIWLVVFRKPLSISFSKWSGLPHSLAGEFLWWLSMERAREERGERERERLETTQKEALSSLWPSLGRYISSLCHTPVTRTIPRPSPT